MCSLWGGEATEEHKKPKNNVGMYYFISAVALLTALWSLMWVSSSYSMAFTHCDQFGLFHENPRCRQPYIAGLLFLLSGISTIAALVVALIKSHRGKKPNQ